MPNEIKQKLRQYQKLQAKAKVLSREIDKLIESYGVPISNLNACEACRNEPHTEALAFIDYAEGNIEENINEIEKVFLYFANRSDANG